MNTNPEHLHVIVNHIPLIGAACALLPLLLGLILRKRESQVIGLLLTLLCAGTIPLVMWTGEEAEHEWLHSDASSHLDAEGREWAHVHEEHAELAQYTIYTAAGLSLLTLITMAIKPLRKVATVLVILSTIATFATVTSSVWVADSGGKISHPEFRTGPPPTLDGEEHEHEHGE